MNIFKINKNNAVKKNEKDGSANKSPAEKGKLELDRLKMYWACLLHLN